MAGWGAPRQRQRKISSERREKEKLRTVDRDRAACETKLLKGSYSTPRSKRWLSSRWNGELGGVEKMRVTDSSSCRRRSRIRSPPTRYRVLLPVETREERGVERSVNAQEIH